MPRPTQIVIIGGGFAGLEAARALAGRDDVAVTVVDRRNHHVFQPLLYQVATAALSPGDIASPIRWILRRQRNVSVRLADVAGIDAGQKCLRLADGASLPFDFLIVAAGVTHAYFGHDDWRAAAPGLKTMEEALQIRRRILLAFERAESLPADAACSSGELTFVVVGGGPTGVELAGALAEIARHALKYDFRRIDPSASSIVLIEGGPRLLASFNPAQAAFAERALTKLGVSVRTHAVVTSVDKDGVIVRGADGRETRVAARTVLWAAGVAASPLGRAFPDLIDRAGRVKVNDGLGVPGHPHIFVVGDLATLTGPAGMPYPGVAQVAIQQGRQAARNVIRAIDGEPPQPFRYRDYGNMATSGRAKAIADFGWFRMQGSLAWLAWLFIHLVNLIGFRNRLSVRVQWAWAYASYQRNVRLITEDEERR
jgi:NADH dehydrogenase